MQVNKFVKYIGTTILSTALKLEDKHFTITMSSGKWKVLRKDLWLTILDLLIPGHHGKRFVKGYFIKTRKE